MTDRLVSMGDAELIELWQQVQRNHIDHLGRTKGIPDRALLDKLVALRREGYRRGMDLHSVPPAPRPADVVRRELESIERKMAGLHRRAYTRAQATTREASLGQLARVADGLRRELARAKGAL